jgi:hypothetical protein
MKRLVYAVVAASAIGLGAGGAVFACEQHMSQNGQGATVEQGKLAMLGSGIVAPQGQIIRAGDDDDKSSDEKKDDGK